MQSFLKNLLWVTETCIPPWPYLDSIPTLLFSLCVRLSPPIFIRVLIRRLVSVVAVFIIYSRIHWHWRLTDRENHLTDWQIDSIDTIDYCVLKLNFRENNDVAHTDCEFLDLLKMYNPGMNRDHGRIQRRWFRLQSSSVRTVMQLKLSYERFDGKNLADKSLNKHYRDGWAHTAFYST